ncbi:DUF2167 domain-containing protein [Pokkaliibacter sp. MBI-7]|uniref:DUF2167 domain-containing protein n=1 Tax=Pokkaliibacter sp. MBI-7 TaxID=3040600 RepID=UPI00244C8136|nr:DUF2167 domain-containing protein [Pokkaliibacter sp. MBI-7]MDH2432495.1 DUF2167 domain-containing protein [Pokkaliibacter sp. MBI-7]
MNTARRWLLLLLCCCVPLLASADTQQTTDQQARDRIIAWAQQFWQSLQRKSGVQTLPTAHAELTIPSGFYFLDAHDSERVLTEVWGNPARSGALGMLFPSDASPFDADAWAVVLHYEAGYAINPRIAAQLDYQALLSQMQSELKADPSDTEGPQLTGWAVPPHFDAERNILYWAKELAFPGKATHTLNYNIRLQHQDGVLVMNIVAPVTELAAISQQLPPLLDMVHFLPDSSTADTLPPTAKVASLPADLPLQPAPRTAAENTALLSEMPDSVAMVISLLRQFWYLSVPAALYLLFRLFRGRERRIFY